MVDQNKIKEGVRLILEGIGEDVDREGLLDTPDRVARMYAEITAGYEEESQVHLSRTFESAAGGMVIEKDISFYSMCEHHMMPFFGKVHIAYIPKKRVVGLSKLARTVEVYARRLQIQEQLGSQICQAIYNELDCEGAAVYIEAEHTCMTMRGIKKPGSKTITIATAGAFDENAELTDRFISLIK